jgi:hypothetical protein
MDTSTTQPPIKLSTGQEEHLEKTLAKCFKEIDLERLLSWRLNIEEYGERIEQLDRFVAVKGGDFDAIVHQFVVQVKAYDKVRELVSGMLEFKPGIQQVQELASELGIQLPCKAQQPPASPEADAQVIEVNVQAVSQQPPLTSQQRSDLIGLLSAFGKAAMEQLVSQHLNLISNGEPQNRLNQLVGTVGLADPEIARQLVDVVASHDMIVDLVKGIAEMRPRNRRVRELARQFGVPVPGPVLPLASQATRSSIIKDRVISFDDRFENRKEQFGYLNAYKQLHDAIHSVEDKLKEIKQSAEDARQNPDDRLFLKEVTIQLQTFVAEAADALGRTEFPNDPMNRKWTTKFADAVECLDKVADSKLPLTELDKALNDLRALPSQLGRLNTEIVQCAKRLHPEELVPLIDDVLGELSQWSTTVSAVGFQEKFEEFRELCARLAQLSRQHDICQGIALALLGTMQTAEGAASQAYTEGEVLKGLMSIASEVSNDPRNGTAAKTVETAEGFESADAYARKMKTDESIEQSAKDDARRSASRAFGILLARFRQLFLATDKQLRSLTGDLVLKAPELDRLLKGFLHGRSN